MFCNILTELNYELIVACLALVVSISSVYYNHITFAHQKEHDKKTSTPHLSLDVLVTSRDGNIIKVINEGFGPALIKSIIYTYNKMDYDDISEMQVEHYPNLRNFIDNNKTTIYYLGDNGGVLGAGKSIELLSLILKDGFDIPPYIEFLKEVEIKVEYLDIYNQKGIMTESLFSQKAYTGLEKG